MEWHIEVCLRGGQNSLTGAFRWVIQYNHSEHCCSGETAWCNVLDKAEIGHPDHSRGGEMAIPRYFSRWSTLLKK